MPKSISSYPAAATVDLALRHELLHLEADRSLLVRRQVATCDPSSGTERRSALRACGLVERGAKALGELDGVVIGPEVHEDDSRLLRQHVAMDRGHLDVVRPQGAHHVIDLRANERIVARDRGLSAASRLKIDGGRTAHDGGAHR